MSLPNVTMKEGIHVMHLFYRVDRMAWAELEPAGSAKAREKLRRCAKRTIMLRIP